MKHLLLCCLLLAGCSTTYRSADVENEAVRWMVGAFPLDTPEQPVIPPPVIPPPVIPQPGPTTKLLYQRMYDIRWKGMDNMQQLWQLNQKYRPTIGDSITWRLP